MATNNKRNTTPKRVNRDEIEPPRYPDSILTSDGKYVRLSSLPANAVIRIGPNRTKVRAVDIPMTAAVLTCGCHVRGIAFQKGDVRFCDTHHDEVMVAEILAS